MNPSDPKPENPANQYAGGDCPSATCSACWYIERALKDPHRTRIMVLRGDIVLPSAWINERILVDAIIGCGFKTMEHAETMRTLGLAKFTGNQWNPDWEWDRAALEKQSIENLSVIYENSLPNDQAEP